MSWALLAGDLDSVGGGAWWGVVAAPLCSLHTKHMRSRSVDPGSVPCPVLTHPHSTHLSGTPKGTQRHRDRCHRHVDLPAHAPTHMCTPMACVCTPVCTPQHACVDICTFTLCTHRGPAGTQWMEAVGGLDTVCTLTPSGLLGHPGAGSPSSAISVLGAPSLGIPKSWRGTLQA